MTVNENQRFAGKNILLRKRNASAGGKKGVLQMLEFLRDGNSNFAAAESDIENGICRIAFTPSPHNGIAKLWFRCRVRNAGGERLPEKTKIVLKNIQGMLCCDTGRFIPVIRRDHSDWVRLGRGTRIVLADGRIQLEWITETPASGAFLELAFCYPYDPEELEQMMKETSGYWKKDEIGVTGDDHLMIRLSNHYGDPQRGVPGLYLLARQHAAEVSGAWVLDGILRRLAEIRPEFPVWCVPFADPDGVMRGDYGKDSFPQDMNRSWGPHALMRHETQVIAADLRLWHQRVMPDRSFVLDLHSPGADETGIYAFWLEKVREQKPAWKTESILTRLGNALAPYAASPFLRTSSYKPYSAWGMFSNLSEFCFDTLSVPFASMETSYFEAGGKVLDRADYRKIGSVIADELTAALKKE